MPIVSARVHRARMRAGVRQSGLLDDRQRVDVSAQCDAGFARVTDPRDRRRRRTGNPANVLDTDSIQLRANRSGGFELLETQLGDLVQAMPQLDGATVLRGDDGL